MNILWWIGGVAIVSGLFGLGIYAGLPEEKPKPRRPDDPHPGVYGDWPYLPDELREK